MNAVSVQMAFNFYTGIFFSTYLACDHFENTLKIFRYTLLLFYSFRSLNCCFLGITGREHFQNLHQSCSMQGMVKIRKMQISKCSLVLHQRPTSQDGKTGEVFMTCISSLLLHTGYRAVAFFATPVLFLQFLFLYVVP